MAANVQHRSIDYRTATANIGTRWMACPMVSTDGVVSTEPCRSRYTVDIMMLISLTVNHIYILSGAAQCSIADRIRHFSQLFTIQTSRILPATLTTFSSAASSLRWSSIAGLFGDGITFSSSNGIVIVHLSKLIDNTAQEVITLLFNASTQMHLPFGIDPNAEHYVERHFWKSSNTAADDLKQLGIIDTQQHHLTLTNVTITVIDNYRIVHVDGGRSRAVIHYGGHLKSTEMDLIDKRKLTVAKAIWIREVDRVRRKQISAIDDRWTDDERKELIEHGSLGNYDVVYRPDEHSASSLIDDMTSWKFERKRNFV
jgi:hypothetical protein